jgi:hypothetical protein
MASYLLLIDAMRKFIALTFLFTISCAANESTQQEPVIEGDSCKLYDNLQACDAHSPCQWVDLGIPCQEGTACFPGVCSAPTNGSGGVGGGSGHGSGTAACECPGTGGVCFEQLGGLVQQGSNAEPQIQCAAATTCAAIQGQGNCSPDPNVLNLCLCDNGIR